MAWEWVAPAGTVIVALAGIGATLRTAAQGRIHAEHLATENYRRAHQDALRQERLKVYAGAMAHAVDQERKVNGIRTTDGEHAYDLSPKPPGAPLSLASMDEVTIQMGLLADGDVEQAWVALLSAWQDFRWWAENEHSGDTREHAPEDLELALRASIDRLKATCKRSLMSEQSF
jgi:hypothetical protein